ncbi:MAG: DUF5004 domain-containing protein [Flavisolibacter sp.]
MKKAIQVLLLFSCSITGIRCSKSASVSTSIQINTQNLSGTYKLTGITAKDNATGIQIDLYSQLKDCQKDDLEILNANGTYQYVDAGTQCSPPGDFTGSWSVIGSKITLDTNTGDIQKFDGKTLIVTSTETNNGSTYTVTQTYTKQ